MSRDEWGGAPPLLAYQAFETIDASREVSDISKRLWERMRRIATGPEGCFQGAGKLAARMALSVDTIERHRRDLLAKGLLIRRERPGKRESSWFPTMPADCVPRIIVVVDKGGNRKKVVDHEDVLMRANRLDSFIRNGGTRADTTAAVPPPMRRGNGGNAAAVGAENGGTPAAALVREGGRCCFLIKRRCVNTFHL